MKDIKKHETVRQLGCDWDGFYPQVTQITQIGFEAWIYDGAGAPRSQG